ncbi:glutamate 5-kinase, partial [Haematococcus lacustris]
MELARGLVNFSAEELQRLKGKSTQEFAQELGYNAQAEVVHRENLALLAGTDGGAGERAEEDDGDDDGVGIDSPLARSTTPALPLAVEPRSGEDARGPQ